MDYDTGEMIVRRPFVRSAFNYDRDQASLASGLDANHESLDPEQKQRQAQQSFREEVDINTIVTRFGLTGELPENVRVPISGDFHDQVNDYQTALNMVIEADNAFMQMPASVRERFANNPAKFIEFLEDKDNLEEARKLGVAMPAPPPEPEPKVIPVRVIPDKAPKE